MAGAATSASDDMAPPALARGARPTPIGSVERQEVEADADRAEADPHQREQEERGPERRDRLRCRRTGQYPGWVGGYRRMMTVHNRYIVPWFVERTSYGTRSSDPYSKMFEDRIIFLGVQVDDQSANDVMAQLLTLEGIDPDRDITMYINSPGGSYTAMTAIYDTMQYVRPDISTVCLGQAASAAALLLAGGTPGKRLALPNSRILIHQPALQGAQGQGSDLEIQAREILRMRSQMEELLAQHTGRPLEQVTRDIDRDKIMTALEAKEYGLVDVVLDSRKANSLLAGAAS